jgi:orotate phosphoribosyltransferase
VVVDRQEGAREMLTEHGIELISLFTVKDLA